MIIRTWVTKELLLWKARAVSEAQVSSLSPSYVIKDCGILKSRPNVFTLFHK